MHNADLVQESAIPSQTSNARFVLFPFNKKRMHFSDECIPFLL